MPDDQALPAELATALRPVLPGLAEDTIAAIGREIPEYARPLEGPFGAALRIGVEQALTRFVDTLGSESAAAADGSRAPYVDLGRGEMRAGRGLDVLLGAYRLGARLAWEAFAAAAEAAGHPPAVLYSLAGAIFAYIDAISAESVEGYAAEQSRSAGELARRRRALVRMLARDNATAEDVADLAAVARWPVPAVVAALVLEGEDADRVGSRLGADAIALAEDGFVTAFVADPLAPGRSAQLAAACGGARAAVGPAVAPARAHLSLLRARAALRLMGEGRLEQGSSPAVADDHLIDLLLHAGDSALAADLATAELGAFETLTPRSRAVLMRTLRAWVDHPGQVQHVAGLLSVHPQTVRYRVAQLRDLLGARLDDAEGRFRLAVALRVAPETGI